MCGILGTINHKISPEFFLRQLNLLQHRGPDGYAVWQNAAGNVKLGHRRLAIIDTDKRANQPMVFDERYIIVFNGEIYNYIELRQELQKKGVRFVTESDTEVLLHLMISEGPAALNKLNGMWSFAIYDDVEQSLFISRDRLGKKPFYYIQQGEEFAFASEMKSLYSLLPDFSYNKDFIAFAVANPMDNEILSETLVTGIQKFPAGSYGIYKQGKLTVNRYYFPEKLLEQKQAYKNFDEAVEQFKALFESSCMLRMRSDVPVGSALSGGIDSGYVVSTIAKLGYAKSEKYTALVSSFPGREIDESEDALFVAKHAGVNSIKVEVNQDIDPEKIIRSVYDFEEIAVTAPVSFFQSYQGFRNKGIYVTLDGHGGDELFGGYPFDMHVKLKDDFPNLVAMRNTLNTINQMYGREADVSFRETLPHFKSQVLKKVKSGKFSAVFEKESHYRNTLFKSTFKGILPTLLRNYDKYSMQAGVEIRMPFLDYRIIEFAFSLPNKYKVRNGFSKAIVRTAASDIVPEMILSNKLKTGWSDPMGEWFAGKWKEWLMDEIHSPEFKNSELVDQAMFHSKVERFYKNKIRDLASGHDLWVHLQPYLIEKANKQFISR